MNELTLTTYGVLFLGLLYFIKGKLKAYDDHMKDADIHQSPTERDALAKVLEAKFTAHEEKDDLRFENMTAAINGKLDLILTAVNSNGKSRATGH